MSKMNKKLALLIFSSVLLFSIISSVSAVSASEDDDAFLGDENAPIVIIEFCDYEGPFCQRFWSETLPLIKSEYIDTGKVKFVYRDFPLSSIHPMAQKAAEAAECVRDVAGSDEAYFEYHDTLFENQQDLSDDNLKLWAEEQGYDIEECLDNGDFTNEVLNDASDAQAAGGRGTPYFLVNSCPISGAQPFSAFEQVIEDILSGNECGIDDGENDDSNDDNQKQIDELEREILDLKGQIDANTEEILDVQEQVENNTQEVIILKPKVEENRNLIEKIINFFRGIFRFGGKNAD